MQRYTISYSDVTTYHLTVEADSVDEAREAWIALTEEHGNDRSIVQSDEYELNFIEKDRSWNSFSKSSTP